MSCHEFQQRVEATAAALGFTRVRHRRHQVWRHPQTGQTVVCGSTPSDHRAWLNVRARFRRAAAAGADLAVC